MKRLPTDIMQQATDRLAHLYGHRSATRLGERLRLLLGRYLHTEPGMLRERKTAWDERDAVLICYGDMVNKPGEPGLQTLQRFAQTHLSQAFSLIHVLPFFPSSSDQGFSVIDYYRVEPSLGDWNDLAAIDRDFDLMIDLVINHVSSQSPWFHAYLNGIAPARDYFIEEDPATDLSAVARPRNLPLLRETRTPAGQRHVWTTFSADQIDVDFSNPDVLFEYLEILLFYIAHGARIIRLDAVAYLWKEVGTSCVNRPQTHEIVKLFRDVASMAAPGVLLLTETNLPHDQNLSYFGQGDEAQLIYQFSLPPLLLHALYTGSTRYLVDWATALPAPPPGCTYLNFTASHDGIGVRPLEQLIPEEEFDTLMQGVVERGGIVSTRAGDDGRESPYELNITWYDALADPAGIESLDQQARFLCSQTLVLALRGIPAVYFHSLTASHNDYSGVELSGEPRAINRKRWDAQELEQILHRAASPVARIFREYRRRLLIRGREPAFHPDSTQEVLPLDDGLFAILRSTEDRCDHILALSNLGSDAMEVDLCAAAPEVCKQGMSFDLLEEQSVPGILSVAPYQTLWLKSG